MEKCTILLLVTALLMPFGSTAHHEAKDLGSAAGAFFSGIGSSPSSSHSMNEEIVDEVVMSDVIEENVDDFNPQNFGQSSHSSGVGQSISNANNHPKLNVVSDDPRKINQNSNFMNIPHPNSPSHGSSKPSDESSIHNAMQPMRHPKFHTASNDGMDIALAPSNEKANSCNCPKKCGCQYKHGSDVNSGAGLSYGQSGADNSRYTVLRTGYYRQGQQGGLARAFDPDTQECIELCQFVFDAERRCRGRNINECINQLIDQCTSRCIANQFSSFD